MPFSPVPVRASTVTASVAARAMDPSGLVRNGGRTMCALRLWRMP